IKEINSFYVKIETNPLSASATVLWYTLMHINNRTRWSKEFSVAAAVLCLKSGLPNSTFKRARTELRDKGYITFTSRGRQAPLYQIISLIEKDEVEEGGTYTESVTNQEVTKVAHEKVDKIHPE